MFFKTLFRIKRPLLPALLASSLIIFLGSLLVSFKTESVPDHQAAKNIKQQFMVDLAMAREQATELSQATRLLNGKQTSPEKVQAAFLAAKKAYKRTEYLTEYLDPELAKKINGAPIPKVVISEADYLTLGLKEPLFITVPPEGFQVLEELLFAEELTDLAEASILALKIEENLTTLQTNLLHQPLTDKQILESLREEVLRVMTMGITGFDAPAAGQEMALAAAALEPVLQAVVTYEKASVGSVKINFKNATENLQKTITYVHQNPDFDSFDRLHFLRELADPAYAALTVLQRQLMPVSGKENPILKPVNDQAQSLFSEDFLLTAYYAKQDRKTPDPTQISLGKMLFFDPVLSSNNQRSCASCHNPQIAFTDGEIKSKAVAAGETVSRNSPTLLNAIFGTAYFWDSRAGFLEDQIPEVIKSPKELHSDYNQILTKLNQSRSYQKLFKQAFRNDGTALTASNLNRALAAYLRSLTALNSPFDKYMRRETEVLSASAKRGANLFMGKAACATCHFAPIFNGTVPPRFLESETEVIGVPATANLNEPEAYADAGRGSIIKAEAFQGAFKTPTVRNAKLTAPYMHNGVFQTLKEVIEFYNRGGGAGLGLTVPNQTLPFDDLSLTEQEKKDLVAFMESLTDEAIKYRAPEKLPDFPVASGLNQRKVGGRY